MEYTSIADTGIEASRIGLGTWAIGGTMWGGTDEKTSIETIRAALDQGITLIDTAPAYGFGQSEEIVGKAIKEYGKEAGDSRNENGSGLEEQPAVPPCEQSENCRGS